LAADQRNLRGILCPLQLIESICINEISFSSQRNHKKIQYSRIIAIIGYIWLIVLIFLACFSDEVRQKIVEENEKTGNKLTSDEVDTLVTAARAGSAVGFALFIIIDFVIRFLVINSLYYRYRDEGKPRFNA
jgi:preprotein translocase subunit SecG